MSSAAKSSGLRRRISIRITIDGKIHDAHYYSDLTFVTNSYQHSKQS